MSKKSIVQQDQAQVGEFQQHWSNLGKGLKIASMNIAQYADDVMRFLDQYEKQEVDWHSLPNKQQFVKIIVDLSEGLQIDKKLQLCKAALILTMKIGIQAMIDKPEIDNPLCFMRTALQRMMRVSQETVNDKVVAEAGLLKQTFQILSIIIPTIEGRNTKKDRRSLFQRKGSLKKIEQTKELPSVALQRPRSKGKTPLPSLGSTTFQKKDSRVLLTQPTEKAELPEDLAYLLLSFVKNCSANPDLRRKLLQQHCLNLLSRYAAIWDEKNITAVGTKMLSQITATHRHLAADQKSAKAFLKADVFSCWTRLIEQFPRSNDIILNIIRLFSKLSTIQQCCKRIHSNKLCIRNLASFFREYRTNIYIIIRVSFIFANMTSFFSDIRHQLYFQFNAFSDIYACFQHYARSQLQGKSEIDKMGISVAAWDYQAMKKQSDIDALVKIIRLLANLFTVSEIGQDIYLNKAIHFKDLIKKLKDLLEKKCTISQHGDLIVCILSCISNALFYDREVLMSNLEYKTTKNQLISLLGTFVVQVENEEICCQGLRVLSNLTRTKQCVRMVIDSKLHEATLILLESSSKQIVYYSLGVLINLLSDSDFKAKFKLDIVCSVLDIIRECTGDDMDIATTALKCIGMVVEGGTENIDGQLLKEIEQALQKLGNQCDMLLVNRHEMSLQQSRNLINLILNNLPEDSFVCSVKNCGRKFPDEKKLKEHFDRRHKLS